MTGLNRRSAKKARSDSVYAEARKRVEFRAFGRCEANTPACPPREHRGTQAHHRLMRSHGGDHTDENLLWVCDAAHDYVHAHPAESYDKGWLIRGVR